MAKIHGAATAYPELRAEFAERRYFEELRLEPYYSYTASQVRAAKPFLEALVADTRARRVALVHGDYSPKNVLLHGGRLILLDHEVIHFGDPAFDIGFSLAHFLGKALHLARHRSAFLAMARAYWRAYHEDLPERLHDAAGSQAPRHTVACVLARAVGRSPLEYLSAAERAAMQRIALELLDSDLRKIPELLDEYESLLDRQDEQDSISERG